MRSAFLCLACCLSCLPRLARLLVPGLLLPGLLVPGLLACALAPSPAFGEVREFGPAFARFLLDVPEGWTAEALEAGVRLVSPDRASFLQASAFRTGAMPPAQVAKAYAGLAGAGSPEALDAHAFVLRGPGAAVTRLHVAGGACLAVAVSGQAPELEAMARSARRAP